MKKGRGARVTEITLMGLEERESGEGRKLLNFVILQL
jgi:hypothetical protein